MTTDTHPCNLYCERPECIRRQRDELRDRQPAREGILVAVALSQLHVLVLALRNWHYHWPDYGGPPARPIPGPLGKLYDELERAENYLLEHGINIYAAREAKR